MTHSPTPAPVEPVLTLTLAATFTADHLERMYGYAAVGETARADDGPLPDSGRAVRLLRDTGQTIRAAWTPAALADLASDAAHYGDSVNGFSDSGLVRSARAVLRRIRREYAATAALFDADGETMRRWRPVAEMLARIGDAR